VVSSATFLIDSESQLKGAVAGMGAPTQHQPHGGTAPSAQAAEKAPKREDRRHD
jgi:hypothetical protein